MIHNHSYSVYFYAGMSAQTFASLNVPLSAVSILLNFFFAHCMVFPHKGAERLKEPLKVLLASLVGCNTTINFCSLFYVFYHFVLNLLLMNWYILIIVSNLISSVMMYTMLTIVTSCHCKNMLYFCQIVPLQHSVLIWFKRNIRALIYSALILNAIFYLFGLTVDIAYEITRSDYDVVFTLRNDTEDSLWNSMQLNYSIGLANVWFTLLYFLLSLCVMLASSCATVLYLWRHMKNMEKSGLVSPRLQRQIKMTITGITVQVLLHFLCSDGIIIVVIAERFSRNNWDSDGFILCTIISLYSFGTTINMGVCQSPFRQGVVHAWQKLLQFFISLN
ncbi:uncharacterized protein LOC119263592 [Pygocentrus nattereri]|uniref:uncharacterized protein LOC119263592 n=1 Tax=Pygocentrus nattereri TaxID=42514 RepID=UPI001890E417|nr:uncharacterized protein LOC119263592 [Pygocentrus nattereri]